MLEFQDESPDMYQVKIKVIGVGGGGCNAVKKMSDFNLEAVELIVANTDMQVLKASPIKNKLQLGLETTRGMGAGSKPEVGKRAAEEDRDMIREKITGADMLFIAAGMGGGTGTGASPVIAEIAREMGVLTIAIVTRPFTYEGADRVEVANEGIKTLKEHADCLVVIPNDRILELMPPNQTFSDSLNTVDDVLKDGVLNIARIVHRVGVVNVDLEDVKTAMSERGIAMLGMGEASGENRAEEATRLAILSPLIEKNSLDRAKGLLATITASKNFQTHEYHRISEILQERFKNSKNKIGVFEDESLGDTIRVTILATGIEEDDDINGDNNPFAGSPTLNNVSLQSNDDGFISAPHESLRVGRVGDEYMEEESIFKKVFGLFTGKKKDK